MDKHTEVHLRNGELLRSKKKLLIHATTWINLKCILQSRRWIQKATYHVIQFIWYSGKDRIINRPVVAKGWEQEKRWTTKGQHEGIIWDDGVVLYLDCRGSDL